MRSRFTFFSAERALACLAFVLFTLGYQQIALGDDPIPPPAPTFSSSGMASGSAMQLDLDTEPGLSYVIRASRDFNTWTTLLFTNAPGGQILFNDSLSPGLFDYRFYRAEALAVVADMDEDGIPDDYELANGLLIGDAGDALGDLDGDFFTNLEEYLNGTNPNVFDTATVSLKLVEACAYEKEQQSAQFRIERTGSPIGLPVFFSLKAAENPVAPAANDPFCTTSFVLPMGGDPTEGGADPADYEVVDSQGNVLSGQIMIPVFAGGVDVFIRPVNDSVAEYPEGLELQLLAHEDYVVGSPSSKRVTIYDAMDTLENETLFVAVLTPEGAAETVASGVATLIINGPKNVARISLNFSGLTSVESAAHVHHADPSNPATGPGPIVESLPLGQFNSHIWNVIATGSFSGPGLIESLFQQNGLNLYLNVHSANYPAGEIRGQFKQQEGSTTVIPPSAPPAIPALSGDDLRRDVVRFLTQATFGPAPSEIDALIADINNNHAGDHMAGYEAWIDEQLSLDHTSLYQLTYAADQQEWALRESNSLDYTAIGNGEPNHNNRRREWWTIAIKSKDQLRQRVAFALSEILIISEALNTVRSRHYGAARYYDMLGEHVTGNYRDLLEGVSESPMMGKYLSHLQSRKAVVDPDTGETLVSPDENFAREIMQLFSIGLLELHLDGTIKLNESGLPIQTYDNDDITELSRVFTGWSHAKKIGSKEDGYPTADNTSFTYWGGPKYFQAAWEYPMINFAAYHDTGSKTFLGGTVPAGLEGDQDLDAALDIIFNHDAVAPFISRRLIQRLVTSNPSRGYLYRVASVFEDNGSGVRGDIGAVVKAILLDYEARGLDLIDDVGYGKVREPILRYLAVLRALDAKSGIPLADLSGHGYPADQLDNFPAGATRYRYGDTSPYIVQSPQFAPSVFNWFLPDYSPGGAVAHAGLVTPELQVATETTTIQMINYHRQVIEWSTGQGVNAMVGATDANEDNVQIDYGPVQQIFDDAVAGGATDEEAATEVVDYLDMLLTAGNLKLKYEGAPVPNPRQSIIEVVRSTWTTVRIEYGIHLLVSTPEFVVQK